MEALLSSLWPLQLWAVSCSCRGRITLYVLQGVCAQMSVSSCHTSIVRDVLDGDCCCNCCWSNSCCCWLLLSTELDLEEEVQLCEWGQSFLRSPLFRSKQPISHSNTDLLEVVVGALGGGNTVGLSKRRDALFDERLIKHQSTTLHSMNAFMKH